MKKATQKVPTASIGMHGFYRVNVVDPDGKVVGDSGYKHNLISTSGLSNFLTQTFLRSAGSSAVSRAAIGTGGAIASGDSSLAGQLNTSLFITLGQQSTVRAASTDGDTARFLGTWASGTATTKIGNVGLYMTTSGSIFCGGSFATSSVASNQAILLTYDVVFIASTS